DGIHRGATNHGAMDRRARLRRLETDRRADRAIYHSGLLHRRDLDGRAHFFGHTTFAEAGRYRFPRIRHLRIAGGRSGRCKRAGAAAAELARDLCGDTAKAILVVAGPGNNGGDAFEVAAHLKRWFFRVSVVFSGERDKLPKDARVALGKWEAAGGTLLREIPG